VKYSVSPPRMLVSRAGTVSSRVTLVLTSANTASLFACIASHPTFAGDVGRQTVQFMLPSGTQLAHTQGPLFISLKYKLAFSMLVGDKRKSYQLRLVITSVVVTFLFFSSLRLCVRIYTVLLKICHYIFHIT